MKIQRCPRQPPPHGPGGRRDHIVKVNRLASAAQQLREQKTNRDTGLHCHLRRKGSSTCSREALTWHMARNVVIDSDIEDASRLAAILSSTICPLHGGISPPRHQTCFPATLKVISTVALPVMLATFAVPPEFGVAETRLSPQPAPFSTFSSSKGVTPVPGVPSSARRYHSAKCRNSAVGPQTSRTPPPRGKRCLTSSSTADTRSSGSSSSASSHNSPRAVTASVPTSSTT